MKNVVTFLISFLVPVSMALAQYDLGDAELNESINTITSKAKTQFSEFKTFITQNSEIKKESVKNHLQPRFEIEPRDK